MYKKIVIFSLTLFFLNSNLYIWAKECNDWTVTKKLTFPIYEFIGNQEVDESVRVFVAFLFWVPGGFAVDTAITIVGAGIIGWPIDLYRCGADERAWKRSYKKELNECIASAERYYRQGDYRQCISNYENALNRYHLREVMTKSKREKIERGIIEARKFVEQPPQLELKIAFKESSDNGFLDAEEKGQLTVAVTNNGKGPSYGTKIKITPKNNVEGIDYPKETSIGIIPAGRKNNVDIEFIARESVSAQTVKLDVQGINESGFDSEPIELVFQTKAFQPPNLILEDVGVKDSNDNGKVEFGELVEVTARIKNIGTGNAHDLLAELVITDKNVFSHGEISKKIDMLKPNESADFTFTVYTNTKFLGKELPIKVKVTEKKGRYGFIASLPVFVHQSQKPLQVIEIKGRESQNISASTVTPKALSKLGMQENGYVIVEQDPEIPIRVYRDFDKPVFQKGEVIAVFNLQPQGMAEHDAVIISDFFQTAIVKKKIFTVVERSKIEKVFEELKLQLATCGETECIIKVGKMLNATKMILGSVGKLSASSYIVNIRVINVVTARIEYADRVESGDFKNLLKKIDVLVKGLSKVTE